MDLFGQRLRRLQHLRQMVANLPGTAAREQGDPGHGRVQAIFPCKLPAVNGWQRQVSKGMAHKLRLYAVLPVKRLLEGEYDQHPADVLADELDAVLLPGPQLRADEVNDRNPQPVKLFGKPKVDLGKVDEHGHAGPPVADGLYQLAILAPDARQMQDNLGQAHDRHVFATDYALQAGGRHALASHAEENG